MGQIRARQAKEVVKKASIAMAIQEYKITNNLSHHTTGCKVECTCMCNLTYFGELTICSD